MLRLAAPILAEQLLSMLVGYTDWWLVGHYLNNPSHLAAMGLMAYVLWLLPTMFTMVSIGATAMVARFIGAGDTTLATRVTNQAISLGIAFATIATLVSFFCHETFVVAMQLQDEAAHLATRYLWFLVPIIPAIMIEQVGIACLRGAGDTVSGFVAKTIVNIVNVAVSASLVTGWWVCPQLGWDGLAIGTVCAHGLGAVIVFLLLLVGRARMKLRLDYLKPNLDLMRRLLRIGVPGGLDMGSVLTFHLIYVAIINRIGTLAAAAHGLGIMIESMAYLPGTAFQVAATTMVGQRLGAQDPRGAVRSALQASVAGGGLMMGAGTL